MRRIHARNSDGGQEPANGCGNQANEEGHEHKDGLRSAGIDGKGLQGSDGQEKNDRQAGQKDIERDFIRSFLP